MNHTKTEAAKQPPRAIELPDTLKADRHYLALPDGNHIAGFYFSDRPQYATEESARALVAEVARRYNAAPELVAALEDLQE